MSATRLERIAQAIGGGRGKWLTLLFWIAAVGLLNGLLPQASSEKDDTLGNFASDKPSFQAERLAREQFPDSADGLPALLTWYREGGMSDEDLSHIRELSRLLAEQPVKHQQSVLPLDKLLTEALHKQLSEDGTTLIQPVLFDRAASSDQLGEGLDELEARAQTVFGDNPFDAQLEDSNRLIVRATGPVGISVDASALFGNADVSLLIATVSLVLVFLLLIYRSPILALIPLIAVGFAYGAITPLLGWMASEGWIDYDSQGLSIMTVLLFGAGTDYCLFLIARFRSELKQEENKLAALKTAFGGSSGAIAMSGLTVMLSLLVLLLAEYGTIARFSVPFSLAILVMMAASLTLVPALLGIIGRVSFFPFIPRTAKMDAARALGKGKPAPAPKPKRTIGDRLGSLVVRMPWRITAATTIILVGCLLFSTRITYTYDTLSSFPADMPSREGFSLIAEHFAAGQLAPVQMIVRSGNGDDLKKRLEGLSYVKSVSEPSAGKTDPAMMSYEVELAVNPYSNEAIDRIPELRRTAAEALSEAGDAAAADHVWIGGQTAEQYDTRATTSDDAKIVIPVIIGLIALLLLAYLRSVIAMAYLIATVLLSYFSALGLGWIVLHYGFGADAIQGLIPLYAFVFIVALGEDYNIFMVSGIWDKSRRMPLAQAVREGVSETGSVITSAGLILAGTFAVLATLPIQVLVQFGTVTAIGVLLDTFIVRPFLVPSLTVIFGKWAFWPGNMKREAATSESK